MGMAITDAELTDMESEAQQVRYRCQIICCALHADMPVYVFRLAVEVRRLRRWERAVADALKAVPQS
jgi:hypothetical protein